ncbi:hypothetical protein JB92DRAFT_2817114 [Gautieria morchelliformis]|nr:hypothetical protein JB92DRAFT_2817114 [Gautieria morchelliformis]
MVPAEILTQDQIRADTARVFGLRPCVGQIKATAAQLKKTSDVVYISGTGSGKTLTFWMPMIYEKDSITILITALSVLGQQSADTLCETGIPAINVTRTNAKVQTFEAIRKGSYRLIVVNPELLIHDSRFDRKIVRSARVLHL